MIFRIGRKLEQLSKEDKMERIEQIIKGIMWGVTIFVFFCAVAASYFNREAKPENNGG